MSQRSTNEMSVRCYRYALQPTHTQARAVGHAQQQARRLWNSMVALLRWAEREQRNGRREALLHEYGRILAGKALTGAAVPKARKLMAERGLASEVEATAVARSEQVEAARKYGRRRLALERFKLSCGLSGKGAVLGHASTLLGSARADRGGL